MSGSVRVRPSRATDWRWICWTSPAMRNTTSRNSRIDAPAAMVIIMSSEPPRRRMITGETMEAAARKANLRGERFPTERGDPDGIEAEGCHAAVTKST